jgi:deoxyribose-phosphate aldolase
MKTMKFSSLNLDRIPKVNTVEVDEQVAYLQAEHLKEEVKIQDLKMILNMIDFTTLDGKDTESKVKKMCSKAANLNLVFENIPTVAAICVFPSMVKTAKMELLNSSVKLASVSTGFPSGQTVLPVKILETQLALDDGADEIDMVISRGKFLEGEYNYVFDEIAKVKEICKDKTLKVILETGELGTLDNVRKASEIAIYAGADFIKTSTGKIQPGATMPVTFVMLQAIKEYYAATGIKIGIKPSGGISNSKTALDYLAMIRAVLGDSWMTNSFVRFGASSLANEVLEQILKIESGEKASADYFLFDTVVY